MIRARPAPAFLVAGLLALAACEAPPEEPPDLPELLPPDPWPGSDLRPALEHPFFDEHAALSDLSLYATSVSGPVDERPDHQHRGSFGVGNGRVFALAGLTDPINTLHSLVGPVYERDEHFFGDTALRLEVDGVDQPFEREWIARVRGAGVLITRADAASHSLYTVDFAARPSDAADLDVPPGIVRILLVSARDGAGGAVSLRIAPRRPPSMVEGRLVETVDEATRVLGYLPWDGAELVEDDVGWRIPIGSLDAGAHASTALVMGTGFTMSDVAAIADQMAETDAASWLEDTLSWWTTFSDRGVQLSVADPRVVDLYDGMRVGIKVQQSAAGAICPMSQYTLVWLRDNIGPMRFLLRAGLHDEARAALDYTFLCATVRGDYSNACTSALGPDDLMDEPDWDALTPFSGRQAAEGPSYVPLMYREYARWTGSLDLPQERWAYLRRGLTGQQMDEDGLQPFSGDETFRIMMGAALGYDIGTVWEEEAWSANSSFLMAAAASWMAEASADVGHPEDEPQFAELAERARSALSEQFRQPGGHHAPFILRDANAPEGRPFEDVNLKGLWSGALQPDDPAALADLEALRATAGRGDGAFQSPLDPSYYDLLGLPITEGVSTGMVPGYVLWTLTALGDVELEGGFDQLPTYADSAGQYAEAMVYDDHSALSPIYDAVGFLGDYTARHRPWEGGINLDAFLYYLAGPQWRPEGGLHLRPHLPNHQPELRMEPLRAGEAAAALLVERSVAGLSASVTSQAAVSFELLLELPLPEDWQGAESAADEAPWEMVTLPGGERLARFPVRTLQPGEVVVFPVDFG